MKSKLYVSVYAGGVEVTSLDYSLGLRYNGSVEYFEGDGYLVTVSCNRLPLSYGTKRLPLSLKKSMTSLTASQLTSIKDGYPVKFKVELFKVVIPELYAKKVVKSDKYKVLLPDFDRYYEEYVKGYDRCLSIRRNHKEIWYGI